MPAAARIIPSRSVSRSLRNRVSMSLEHQRLADLDGYRGVRFSAWTCGPDLRTFRQIF